MNFDKSGIIHHVLIKAVDKWVLGVLKHPQIFGISM